MAETPRAVAQRLILAFAVMALLVGVAAAVTAWLRTGAEVAERAATDQARKIADLERARFHLEQKVATSRAYLLTGDTSFRADLPRERGNALRLLADLEAHARTPESRAEIAAMRRYEARHHAILASIVLARDSGVLDAASLNVFRARLKPARDSIDSAAVRAIEIKNELMARDEEAADRSRDRATWISYAAMALAIVIGGVIVWRLSGSLSDAFAREEEARRAAEALVDEVRAQSAEAERALTAMQAERDRARTADRGR